MALLALSIGIVFGGALALYFAQEDFLGLAIASGIEPRHAHLWRYISVQTFMDITHPAFGNRAWTYHATSLLLHALNSALLFWMLSARFRVVPAFLGAAYYATHPALFTALYWISARADLLAATFALTAVFFFTRTGRARWMAVPAYLLSLLSKESTILLPAVLWAITLVEEPAKAGMRRLRRDASLHAALAVIGVAYLVYLVQAGPGIAIGGGTAAAYSLDFGSSVLRNALTYVGWALDLAMARPGLRFVDTQNPSLFLLASGAIAAALAAMFVPGLRRRGWPAALAAWTLLLLPVLPLRNHTYHYYLYAPLLAAGWALAVLVDAVMERLGSGAGLRRGSGHMMRGRSEWIPWAMAGALWAILTWNGARLTRSMEDRPSPVYPELRGDPIIDRARIADRAVRSVRTASPPPGAELQFIMRERLARIARVVRGSGEAMPPKDEVYPETNVRTAVQDGVGILVTCPDVAAVSFTLQLGAPAAGRLYAIYAPTGEVEIHDSASVDSLLRSDWVTRW